MKRAVQQNPHSLATVFGARTLCWSELGTRVSRLGAGLRSTGIAPGDRVAVLALNSDRYLEIYVATPWIGGVIVPLNTRWSANEIVYALNDSGAQVLLIDDPFVQLSDAILAQAQSVRTVIHMGDLSTPSGMVSYESLIGGSAPIPAYEGGVEDLAGIFYTGGTTGFPKGVMLSHRALWASAVATAMQIPLITRDSISLHVAPLFHLAGFCHLLMSLLSGAQQVMIQSFSPEQVLSAIEKHQVTGVMLVPTMIYLLVSNPLTEKANLSSLRYILYGASPIPEERLREAMRALPGCQFFQGYGQTELSPVATVLSSAYHTLEGPNAGRLTSAGRATCSCEVEVVDGNGFELPRGMIGEIRVRGLNTMLGYWNKPRETAAALRDGWVYTGDVGRMDADGFLYVVDRIKDMVISGGENIYTVEVENACVMHSAVSQCAVIGVPHETLGEAVHAIVILKPGEQLSASDLIDHCRCLIAAYKGPRTVEFRTEAFPVSAAGKVLKRHLRAPHWEGLVRQIN